MTFDLISADDHLIEPPRIWQDRLPARFREAGPKVADTDGMQHWVYEGKPYRSVGLHATAGKPPEAFSMDPLRYDDLPPGCYEPLERLAVMDEDGVRASVCFPTFPRSCGQTFLEAKDRELANLCVKAYNDFIIDEWSGAAPGRLIPMIIGQLWDPCLLADEVERCAARGAKALTFSENPAKLGLPSLYTSHWDPVLRTLSDTGIPLCLHIGSSSEMPQTSADAPFAVTVALSPQLAHRAAVDLMLGPPLRKFPDLKVVLSESSIGWVPFALEYTDFVWERHRYTSNLPDDIAPSELFRRNIWVCVIDEQVGIEMRDKIGVDRIMWECDYPHSDSSFPNSQKRAAAMFGPLPKGEAELISHGNAERVFGI